MFKKAYYILLPTSYHDEPANTLPTIHNITLTPLKPPLHISIAFKPSSLQPIEMSLDRVWVHIAARPVGHNRASGFPKLIITSNSYSCDPIIGFLLGISRCDHL